MSVRTTESVLATPRTERDSAGVRCSKPPLQLGPTKPSEPRPLGLPNVSDSPSESGFDVKAANLPENIGFVSIVTKSKTVSSAHRPDERPSSSCRKQVSQRLGVPKDPLASTSLNFLIMLDVVLEAVIPAVVVAAAAAAWRAWRTRGLRVPPPGGITLHSLPRRYVHIYLIRWCHRNGGPRVLCYYSTSWHGWLIPNRASDTIFEPSVDEVEHEMHKRFKVDPANVTVHLPSAYQFESVKRTRDKSRAHAASDHSGLYLYTFDAIPVTITGLPVLMMKRHFRGIDDGYRYRWWKMSRLQRNRTVKALNEDVITCIREKYGKDALSDIPLSS
jgi:hypothetical protein